MVTKEATTAILADMIALLGPLDGASFGLFKGTPVAGAVLADIVPANFTSYAVKVLESADWTAGVSSNGTAFVAGAPANWKPTNDVNLPQLITGAYLFKGADLLRWAKFPTGLNVTAVNQQLHATPLFALGSVDPIPQEGATI